VRKHESEFLGFTIRANRKGKKRVAHTGIKSNKRKKIKAEAKKRLLKLKASPTAQNVLLFNSFVLGIHNYFNRATHVYNEFSRLAYELRPFIYNRLKAVGKFEHPTNPPPVYRKFYSLGIKTFKVCNVYLFPLADVSTRNNMSFSQSLTPFTKAGRERIHKQLQPDIQREISLLMKSSLPARSVEYMDNRISRYSMKMGKCEITDTFLCANDVHCHHYIPLHLGGDDKFNNLRILHKDVHRLIHHTNKKAIDTLIIKHGISKSMLQKINKYRQMSGMEQI
jgi:RNA-directed DNA polymerase